MKNTLLFFLLFLAVQLQAQNVSVAQHAYGTTERCFAPFIVNTTDGNVLLAGSTYAGIGFDKTEPSKGVGDYWLLKLDTAGNVTWDKTLGGSNEDELHGIVVTRDHGYLMGGYSFSPASFNKSENNRDASYQTSDYWIIKTDSLGNKQWDKTLGGNQDEILTSLDTTADGGYIIGGYSYSGISGDKTVANTGVADYWIVKLDALGNKQWEKTFGLPFDEVYLRDIIHTADGGFLLAGNLGVTKLDASGNQLWRANTGDNVSSFLVQLPNGNYVAGGTNEFKINGTHTGGRLGANYWIAEIDNSGTVLRDKVYGGNNSDNLTDMKVTNDGGLILTGYSYSGISGDKTDTSRGIDDYWTVKLSPGGTVVWDKTLGGSGQDEASSIVQVKPNTFVVAGSSGSRVSGDRTKRLKGTLDFWVTLLKFQPNAVAAENTFKPINVAATSLTGVKIFPNPASDVLHVYSPSAANYSLVNTNGKAIATYNINGQADLNIHQLPTGVYYLKNIANGNSQKVVISNH